MNQMSDAQGPGSFNDFIEGNPVFANVNRADQVLAYSRDVIQPNKIRLMAAQVGDTAVSPMVKSIGRNDG